MGKKLRWVAGIAFGIALLAAGCGSREREATEAAINAAQSAINAVQDEAQKYVPDQLQAAKNALQDARNALAKSDYDKALAAARDAANRAKEIALAAVSKREEWEKSWKELNDELPRDMEQVRRRVDLYLSKGVRLPEGVDKEIVEAAKTQYEELKQRWAEAEELAKDGRLGAAIEKATGVREALAKIKEMLKIRN